MLLQSYISNKHTILPTHTDHFRFSFYKNFHEMKTKTVFAYSGISDRGNRNKQCDLQHLEMPLSRH